MMPIETDLRTIADAGATHEAVLRARTVPDLLDQLVNYTDVIARTASDATAATLRGQRDRVRAEIVRRAGLGS